jgi:hypothetical protein
MSENESRTVCEQLIREAKIRLFDAKDKRERQEWRRTIHNLQLLIRRKVLLPGESQTI